jgi:hypothetical protein
LADRVDVRARYTHVEGVNEVALGPKLSLLQDRIGIALPVGFAFGGGVRSSKTWQTHPTLLLTAPVDRHFELNASGKVLVPFSEGDTLVAFNVGLGVGDLDRWAIRPEFGMLFEPGQGGHFSQFSVGVTYVGGARKKPRPATIDTSRGLLLCLPGWRSTRGSGRPPCPAIPGRESRTTISRWRAWPGRTATSCATPGGS